MIMVPALLAESLAFAYVCAFRQHYALLALRQLGQCGSADDDRKSESGRQQR